MDHSFSRLFLLFCSTVFIRAAEYCPGNTLFQCPDYCCAYRTCCSDCEKSIVTQHCYTPFPIGIVISAIGGSITGIILFSLMVCICCGCICSKRTGIQRRGRVFRQAQPTVTVITQSGYPQGQVIYPQGQVVYPEGQIAYPNPSAPADNTSPGLPPPYPVVQQGYPPAYTPNCEQNNK